MITVTRKEEMTQLPQQAAIAVNLKWQVCLVGQPKTSDADVEALPTKTLFIDAPSYASMVRAVRANYPRSEWAIDDFNVL
jgi:hypothetical protein